MVQALHAKQPRARGAAGPPAGREREKTKPQGRPYRPRYCLESARNLSITLRGAPTASLPVVASIVVDSFGNGPNAQAIIASAANPLPTLGSMACAALRRGCAAVRLVTEARLARGLRLLSRLVQKDRKSVRCEATLQADFHSNTIRSLPFAFISAVRFSDLPRSSAVTSYLPGWTSLTSRKGPVDTVFSTT